MPIIQLDYVGLIVQNPSSSPEKTGSNMMTIPDISWLLCPFFISQDPATCIHATFAAGSLGRKSGTFHPELPATVAKSKIRFFFSCEISPFSSFWGTHAISKKDGMIWNGKPFLLKKNIHFYIFLSFSIYTYWTVADCMNRPDKWKPLHKSGDRLGRFLFASSWSVLSTLHPPKKYRSI